MIVATCTQRDEHQKLFEPCLGSSLPNRAVTARNVETSVAASAWLDDTDTVTMTPGIRVAARMLNPLSPAPTASSSSVDGCADPDFVAVRSQLDRAPVKRRKRFRAPPRPRASTAEEQRQRRRQINRESAKRVRIQAEQEGANLCAAFKRLEAHNTQLIEALTHSQERCARLSDMVAEYQKIEYDRIAAPPLPVPEYAPHPSPGSSLRAPDLVDDILRNFWETKRDDVLSLRPQHSPF